MEVGSRGADNPNTYPNYKDKQMLYLTSLKIVEFLNNLKFLDI